MLQKKKIIPVNLKTFWLCCQIIFDLLHKNACYFYLCVRMWQLL